MIRTDKICEKLIWLLTLIFVVSLYLFAAEDWGRYLYFGTAMCIFVLTVIRFKGVIGFSAGRFHLFLLLFAVYSLFSVLWAWDSAAAISKFQMIMSILVCYSLIYPYYSNRYAVDELLNVIMWAGYVVAVYSIYYYGFDTIRDASSAANMRLENSYNNINSISMICAFACVIQVYKLVFHKFSFSSLFLIPCIAVITAMQSKKAIFVLVDGFLFVFILKNLKNRDLVQKVIRVIVVIAIFVGVAVVLSRLPIFNGVNQRIERLIASFTGQGKVDRSSTIRAQMRLIGMQQFWKTPFCGIGIGSSHILVSRLMGENTYLHNNYIELLTCGGIIGTALYYIPYFIVGKTFLKKANLMERETGICVILLLQLFIWDFGAVSYSTKIHYFYMMLFFIQADYLKESERKQKSMKGEADLCVF